MICYVGSKDRGTSAARCNSNIRLSSFRVGYAEMQDISGRLNSHAHKPNGRENKDAGSLRSCNARLSARIRYCYGCCDGMACSHREIQT